MDDALGADVHPAAGGHLAVVDAAQRGQPVEVLRGVEHPDHEAVGDDGARRLGPRRKEPQRVARAHHQGLLVVHDLQVALDEQVLHPVLADLARLAVGHQLVGVEGDVEVEVVVDHHLHGPRLGDATDVGVDGPAGDPAGRPVAVAVDPAPGAQLLEKLRRHDLVVLLGDVAQRVLQRDDRVAAVEVAAARRRPPDPWCEDLRLGKLVQFDGQHGLAHFHLRDGHCSAHPASESASASGIQLGNGGAEDPASESAGGEQRPQPAAAVSGSHQRRQSATAFSWRRRRQRSRAAIDAGSSPSPCPWRARRSACPDNGSFA